MTRTIIALQQFPVSVRKGRDVKQIANVSRDARQRIGNPQMQRTMLRMHSAHRGEMFGERTHLQTAEVVLSYHLLMRRRHAIKHQPRDGVAQIAHVEHRDPSACGARQRMHRPARDASDPPRTESAVAVEQRRPHDMPVGAAIA